MNPKRHTLAATLVGWVAIKLASRAGSAQPKRDLPQPESDVAQRTQTYAKLASSPGATLDGGRSSATASLSSTAEGAVETHSHWFGRRALSETIVTNGALLGIGALTGIVTARVLGPTGRGQVAIAIGVSGILWPVFSLGLQQALGYMLAQRNEDAAKAVGLCLGVSLISGGVVAAIGALLAGFIIGSPATRLVVQLGLLSVPFAIANAVLVGVLQGLRLGRRFNLARVSTPVVYAALLVAMVIVDRSSSAVDVIWIYLAASLVGGIAAFGFLPASARRVTRPDGPFWVSTIRYGLFVSLSGLGYTVNKQLPVIVVGAVGAARDAGQYAVAMGYALPVSVVAVALAIHTLPDIAAEPDLAARHAEARRRLRNCLIGTAPLAAVGIAAAPLLIPLAFGPHFHRAIPIAQVLVLAQAGLGVSYLLTEVSRGLGHPGLPAIAEWIGVLLTCAAIPVAFIATGLTGAASASAVIYLVVIAVLLTGNRDALRLKSRGRLRRHLAQLVQRLRSPRPRWPLAVAYALVCAGLWYVSTVTTPAAAVGSGSGLVIATALPTAARLRRDPLDAPGLYAATAILMFGLLSLAWIGHPYKPTAGVEQTGVASALRLAAGALIAFGIGARVFGPARRRPPLSMSVDAAPPATLLAILLIVSALAAGLAAARGVVGFGSAVGNGSASGLSQPLYQMINVGGFVVAAAAIRAFALRRGYLLLTVLVGIEAAVGFVAGFKGLSLIPIVLVALAYIDVVRRIPWRVVVAGLVVVLALLPANAAYRASRQPEPGAILPSLPHLMLQETQTYVLYRFRLVDQLAVVHSLTPSVYAFGDGSHYEYLPALAVVPRLLWPSKPIVNSGLEFSHSYLQTPGYLTTTVGATQIGDLYRNFGYVGVAIGLFVLGLLIAGFGALCRRLRSPRTELVYLYCLISYVVYLESDIPNTVLTASKALPVALVVAWALLPGRRGVPGYRWVLSRARMFLPGPRRIAASSAADERR